MSVNIKVHLQTRHGEIKSRLKNNSDHQDIAPTMGTLKGLKMEERYLMGQLTEVENLMVVMGIHFNDKIVKSPLVDLPPKK